MRMYKFTGTPLQRLEHQHYLDVLVQLQQSELDNIQQIPFKNRTSNLSMSSMSGHLSCKSRFNLRRGVGDWVSANYFALLYLTSFGSQCKQVDNKTRRAM